MIDFQTWQAGRIWCADITVADPGTTFEGPGHYYPGGTFICAPAEPASPEESFGLFIGNCEWWSDDLRRLEQRLWLSWAKGEFV